MRIWLKRYSVLLLLVATFLIFGIYNYNSFRSLLARESFERAKIEIENEIENKLKSTMAIALTIAESISGTKDMDSIVESVSDLPEIYKRYTKYKNVWIELVDSDQNVIFRSWDEKRGDKALSMQRYPGFVSTISLNKYTLALYAIAPFQKEGKNGGYVNVITHFNSIIKNLERYGYDIVVVADRKFANSLEYARSDRFLEGYYVVNFEPSIETLSVISKIGIDSIIQNENYIYTEDRYIYKFALRDFNGEILGWALVVKSGENLNQFLYKNEIIKRLFVLFFVVSLFVALIIYLYTKDKEKALKKQADYYFKIFDSLQEILVIYSGRKLKYANRRFLEHFGNFNSVEEFISRYGSLERFFRPKEGFLYSVEEGDWLEKLLQEPSAKIFIDFEREFYVFQAKASKIEKEDIAIIFTDITDEYRNRRRLEEEARKDRLTSLLNRRSFDLSFAEIVKNHKEPLWLAIADIDHFKSINDRYGHKKGDEVLREVGSILKGAVREEPVFRIGGEEFAIIVEGINKHELRSLLQRVNMKIKSETLKRVGFAVTVSIGAARFRHKGAEDLFDRADAALYEAKRGGRDTVVIKDF